MRPGRNRRWACRPHTHRRRSTPQPRWRQEKGWPGALQPGRAMLRHRTSPQRCYLQSRKRVALLEHHSQKEQMENTDQGERHTGETAMTADLLTFPSCGTPGDNRHRGIKSAAPARQVVKVVRFDGAAGDAEKPLHNFGAGNDWIHSTLDLADVRLAAAEFASQPLLRLPLLLAPCRQFQTANSRSGTQRYSYGLYLVNGHKHVVGAEYKQMTYVLSMHPANRLRELRKAAGLNQSELAQRTGVSQPYISQVENQAAVTLDIARMRVLAREFGCSPADLLSDEDNPDRLSAEERDLIASYRAASEGQREMIRRVAAPLEKPAERRAA